MPRRTYPVAERFWAKVKRRGPDECWEWQGAKQPFGYGSFRPATKAHIRAHRYAYEEANGPIPKGLVVMHRCDNPPCCNPAHLSLGTMKDNTRDCIAKGRFKPGRPRGERMGNAKLCEAHIREIRAAPSGYGTGLVLARKFGVTNAAISAIRTRKLWKHVD